MKFNMMQPIATHKYLKTLLLFIIVGAILFNAIFWHEKLAINTLLFGVFIIVSIRTLYPQAFSNKQAKWLLAAVGFSFSMVLIYNSAISCIAAITAMLLLMAYCKYQHRSIVYATGSALQSYWQFIPQFLKDIKQLFSQKKKATAVFKKFRFAILPLLIVVVFFIIYLLANKIFADAITLLTEKMERGIQPLINLIEPQRLLFLLTGLLISGGLLYRCYHPSFEKAEALLSDNLVRTKKVFRPNYMGAWQSFTKLFIGNHAGSNLALKYEYKAGMLSLVILNCLLLIVNGTDVIYLWSGNQYRPGFEWAAYVHEGAEILVFSIVLAMLVVLFFFRGNLNFFSGRKRLQQVAYLWLAQNAFLTVSVCIRNFYYITHMGIAYKRIGLFVFALLVFAGLVSVFMKIRYAKTRYYLIKFNAAVAFAVLILSTSIQWDVVIARYNLSHKDVIPVDVAFLLTLSNQALPVLEQHKDFLNAAQTPLQRQYYFNYETGQPGATLESRIADFLYQSKKYTWLSWNLADAKAKKALQSVNNVQAVK